MKMRGRKRLRKVVKTFDWANLPTNVWQVIYQTNVLSFSDFVAMAVCSKTLNRIIHTKVPWQEMCYTGTLVNPYNRIRMATSNNRSELYSRLKKEIFLHWCCTCCKTFDEETIPRHWSKEVGVWFPQCMECFLYMRGQIAHASFKFDNYFACCPVEPPCIEYNWRWTCLKSDAVSYQTACFFQILTNVFIWEPEKAAVFANYLRQEWSGDTIRKLHFLYDDVSDWVTYTCQFIETRTPHFCAEWEQQEPQEQEDSIELFD